MILVEYINRLGSIERVESPLPPNQVVAIIERNKEHWSGVSAVHMGTQIRIYPLPDYKDACEALKNG